VLCIATGTWVQSASPLPSNGIQLGPPQKQRWQVGVRVVATAECAGIYATIPVPTDWPEQTVKIVDEEISSHVARVDYAVLDRGVQQMHIHIPVLAAGETASAIVTFEVAKSAILPPTDTKQFLIPKSPPRDIIRFLGVSPYIEVRHREIRDLARELTAADRGAWETVEGIYDWVRDHVEYQNGPLKGALAALRDGTGDCEELTSLFVALCRASKIPARTVWNQGHSYPEFYLEDASGAGHWFPCQAAGRREFGGMEDFKPILQKGDNFRVPERKREPQRYVAEFLTGSKFNRNNPPQVTWVRKLLPAGS
jgi:hypothetical protein